MLRTSTLALAARRAGRPLLAAAALAALALGCKKEPPAATKWDDHATPPPSPRATAPGASAPSPHTAPAPTAPPPANGPKSATTGTVAETMDSGGYTYARLAVGGQDVWVAGPQTKVAVGASVDFGGGALMTGFRSDTLNRTFEQIYFINSFGGAPAAAGDPMSGTENPHAAGAPKATPMLAPGEVIAPAAGGQAIAQVFASKATLAGKSVTVRGKVVKYNEGILGKNWLHLQDGTGADGTNDLTITTDGTTSVGAVVTVTGVLALDKDVGAGYRYDVLIENATLAAQ